MKGTPEQLRHTVYKLATEGYLHELRTLVKLTKSNEFKDVLPLFANYEHFLRSERENIFTQDLVKQLFTNKQTILASDSSALGKKLFAFANLSACCEIFSGWTIPVAELEMSKTNEYLQLALQNAGNDYENIGRNMAVRLNKCDTARVMQPLKLLGLLRQDSHNCEQLSICCSVGERDRQAMHHVPHISPASLPGLSAPQASHPPLRFSSTPYSPKHIVMIDNDTALDAVYEQFNREQENLLAMNIDLYKGLEELASQIKDNTLNPRNLVVAFRLAPEAFPDTRRYLDSLAHVITEEADLIMTIGAGDNLAEFTHRIKVMNAIFDDLTKRGMSPVRIKYCKGNTPKQQQLKLIYGLSQYASYETIYCRLSKNKLM